MSLTLMKFIPRKKQYTIGLEIWDNQLYCTQLSPTINGWEIIASKIIELNLYNQKQLDEAFQQISQCMYCRKVNTTLGVNYQNVISKEIQIEDSLSDLEIYLFLNQQANYLFGLTNKELFIDYQPIFHDIDSQKKQIRVAAIRKQKIKPILEYCHKIGLKVIAIDIDILSIGRLLPFLCNYFPEKCCVIGLPRQQALTFTIYHYQQLLFNKTITYPQESQQNLTEKINQALIKGIKLFTSIHPQKQIQQIILLGLHDHIEIIELENRNFIKIEKATLNLQKVNLDKEGNKNKTELLVSCSLALRGIQNL